MLEAYLKQLGTATIELYTINNTFKTAGVYEVRKGSANALISYLQKIVYDGGTDYSKIRFADADETLLFTDGLSTLSDAGQLKAPHAVYTITSSAKANFGALKSIAELNAGSFINLAYSNEEDAIKQLTMQALSFLGVRKNKNVAEHYPSIPTSVQNGFSISGQWNGIPTVITLQFGYGKVVAFEQSVSLHFDEYEAEEWDLAKLFAQKKILQLEQDYDHHSDQILQLGKQYSIVTRNTSLLVLENVMDYVRNEIEPPTELRSEYKRLLKERRDELSQQQQHTLDNAIKYSNQLWQWYHTSYPVKRKAAVKYIDREASDVVASVVDTAVVVYDEGEQAENLPPPPPPQQESQRINEVRFTRPGMIKDEEVAFKAFVGRTPGLQVNDVVVAGYGAQLITTKDAQEAAVPEIRLQEKTPAATYLKVLSTTPRNQQYQTYLELREKNLSNPTFYYDVATFFLKQDRALGLQILTNLADLDFENHELLKLLAFQLRYLGQLDQQQYVFKKILLLRPQEPQSYRDYAMALAEKGRYQAALDTLYLALKKDYNTDVMERYEGIEETIVTEINHLISKYNTLVHPSFIHPKHIHSMPVDIRVVLNWNMNDTDIDLWVTDPGGEKCFYSNRQTRIGGRMSEDFTDGYGPEQFLLKKAVKGKYQIQVNYYGESGVKIAGKTTLLAEVFTNYGRSTEQRKLITLQLEGEEKEGVYVGTFVF